MLAANIALWTGLAFLLGGICTTYFSVLSVEGNILVFAFSAVLLLFAIYRICRYNHNPFHFPYFDISIDISRRREPRNQDLVEEWLIEDRTRYKKILEKEKKMLRWEEKAKQKVQRSPKWLRPHRQTQFDFADDKAHFVRFLLLRNKTKYRQRNYRRYGYVVAVQTGCFSCDTAYIRNTMQELQKIGFQTTTRAYNEANQRKLMSPQLRRQILERDGYACKYCGKYLPNGEGAEIDHIFPVSKGGKTVPNNLQTLCRECNRKKSDKIYPKRARQKNKKAV